MSLPSLASAECSPPPPLQGSGSGGGGSANPMPNEDWTKIVDAAERRRIQNRISQRNYRKKLKKRLELLERRAELDRPSSPLPLSTETKTRSAWREQFERLEEDKHPDSDVQAENSAEISASIQQTRGSCQPQKRQNTPVSQSSFAMPATQHVTAQSQSPWLPTRGVSRPSPANPLAATTPGTDPVVLRLHEKAGGDSEFRFLKSLVMQNPVLKQEQTRFYAVIDQIAAEMKRKEGPDSDDNNLPDIFRYAQPDIYYRDVNDKYAPCHSSHKDISTLMQHLSHPAHRLRVTERLVSSFEIDDENYIHPRVGICRQCWAVFYVRKRFDAHLQSNLCSKALRSIKEKWKILYHAFTPIVNKNENTEHLGVFEPETPENASVSLPRKTVFRESIMHEPKEPKEEPKQDDDIRLSFASNKDKKKGKKVEEKLYPSSHLETDLFFPASNPDKGLNKSSIELSFSLHVSSGVKTVRLLGSWDNYAGQIPLRKDKSSSKPGSWKGTFRFQPSILEPGLRYWYYYIIDGYHISHNASEPSTVEPTTGRELNILDVPKSKSSFKSHSASKSSSRHNESPHSSSHSSYSSSRRHTHVATSGCSDDILERCQTDVQFHVPRDRLASGPPADDTNTRDNLTATMTPAIEIAFKEDEIILTDSGYASAPTRKNLFTHQSSSEVLYPEPQVPAPIVMGEKYSRTCYSAATTVAPARAQTSISELAQDIYSKIHTHADPNLRLQLDRSLPDLVKALAIRIGKQNGQRNRDIMYFIHKRHREIVAQLQDLFLHGDDELPTKLHKREGMSLEDKMALWSRNSQLNEPVLESTEVFEGVLDDKEEEFAPESELSSYSKIIMGTPAYSWFITNLQKECSLVWNEQDPRSMISGIRRDILNKLPSSMVSKRRVPRNHRATFRLFWEDLEARIRYERSQGLPRGRTAFPISEFITIMCSTERMQAATVEEYFAQTWPSAGKGILEVLRVLEESPRGHFHSSTLADDTRVTAVLEGSYAFFTIIGIPYSIAECGEQLAWLSSAFHTPRNGAVTYTKAVIHDLCDSPDIRETLEDAALAFKSESRSIASLGWPQQAPENRDRDRQPEERQAVKRFLVESLVSTVSRSPSKECSWDNLFGHSLVPVIVQGFPISRLPEDSPGLQLSFRTLQRVTEGWSVSFGEIEETVNIGGRSAHLELICRKGNVFYWHPTHGSAYSSRYHRHALGSEPSKFSHDHLRHSDLETGQHVLCECKDTSFDIQENFDAMSAAPGSATSESLNTGILSISSDSKDVERHDQTQAGFQIFMRLFRRLVLAFGQEANDGQSTNNSSAGNSAGNVADGSSSTFNPSSQGQCHLRKRKRPNDSEKNDEDDDDNDDDKLPPRKVKTKQSGSLGRPRHLACPFWKSDPSKHWQCFLKRLNTVSYVKQHLNRRHTPNYYCPRCYDIFPDEPMYDRHLVEVSCIRGASTKLDGITHPQSKLLSRKSKGSVEDQWFAIWEILYPGKPRPVSIFVDSDQSEDFCLMREFSYRHGPRLLLEELRASGHTLRSDHSDNRLQEALRRGLDSIFEYFRLGGYSIHPTPRDDSYQDNPVGSSADSGVALGPRSSSHGSSWQSSTAQSTQPQDVVGSNIAVATASHPSSMELGPSAANSNYSPGNGHAMAQQLTDTDWQQLDGSPVMQTGPTQQSAGNIYGETDLVNDMSFGIGMEAEIFDWDGLMASITSDHLANIASPESLDNIV